MARSTSASRARPAAQPGSPLAAASRSTALTDADAAILGSGRPHEAGAGRARLRGTSERAGVRLPAPFGEGAGPSSQPLSVPRWRGEEGFWTPGRTNARAVEQRFP